MVELVVLAAFALAVAGVAGAFLPLLPGATLSIAGIYLYWWHTGYTDPHVVLLAAFTLLALVAVVLDYGGGALAAKTGGASTRTTVIAAVVALPLTLVAGPVGLLAGVAGTVFLLEYADDPDPEANLRAAAYATAGVVASAAVQFVVTSVLLLGLLAVYLL